MDQNPEGKNQNFFRKYQTSLILGVILVLVVIYFATRPQAADNDNADNQNQEQTNNGSNSNENSNGSQNPTPPPAPTPTGSTTTDAGNVSAVGTLKASDNATRGNLMVESDKGKIYIRTSRDQSALLGKQVTLQAQGTLNSFTFLGFKEGRVAGSETDTPPAVGGGDTVPANVKVSGKLMASDNTARGNYLIDSASGKIYLKSVRDYSAWVGSDVNLQASGTLQSFTNAVLTKK
jgi:hypothetical protein